MVVHNEYNSPVVFGRKTKRLLLYKCIQVGNPPLPINLYIMVVHNEYNSPVVFDGKTKRNKYFI